MPLEIATAADVAALNARIAALEAQAGAAGVALEGPLVAGPERLASLPIDGQLRVLFSIEIAELKPADVVLLLAQFEVTNPYSYNVGLGRYIVRTIAAAEPTGALVLPANMDNVTPAMHHRSEDVWTIDAGQSGTQFYNIGVYAAASAAPAGAALTVEQGYGKCAALVFRR